jgi:hypothetical protein
VAECSAEVAVTGKSEIERQSRKVVLSAQQLARARQAQLQLVPIEGNSHDLAKYFRQVCG